jgi:hypothetical protein
MWPSIAPALIVEINRSFLTPQAFLPEESLFDEYRDSVSSFHEIPELNLLFKEVSSQCA